MRKSEAVKELERMAHEYRIKKDPNIIKKYYSERTAPELEKCIILYCELLRRKGKKVFAIKVETMGRMILKDGKAIFVRNNNYSGKADISLIIYGKSIEVEVKCKYTKDNFQNDAQKTYEKKVLQAGGIYWLIHEFSEFKTRLDEYLENEIF